MKKMIFLFAAAAACSLGHATVDAPESAKPAAGQTEITAKLLEYRPEFDVNGGLLVYSGDVRVENPRIKLFCDRLVIFLPKNGDQPNRIEAQTNVVIIKISRGETTRATCSSAIYTHSVSSGTTNSIITLMGKPRPFIEDSRGTLTGDTITWDLVTEKKVATNPTTTIKMGNTGSGTNQLLDKLF